MEKSDFTIEEIYIDDPHWNSGFYESIITFKNGYSFNMPCRKSEATLDSVKEMLVSKLTQKAFDKLLSKYNDFLRSSIRSSIRKVIEENAFEFDVRQSIATNINSIVDNIKLSLSVSFKK